MGGHDGQGRQLAHGEARGGGCGGWEGKGDTIRLDLGGQVGIFLLHPQRIFRGAKLS